MNPIFLEERRNQLQTIRKESERNDCGRIIPLDFLDTLIWKVEPLAPGELKILLDGIPLALQSWYPWLQWLLSNFILEQYRIALSGMKKVKTFKKLSDSRRVF